MYGYRQVENTEERMKVALQTIQFHSAWLCYALNSLRFKKLGLVPKGKRLKVVDM